MDISKHHTNSKTNKYMNIGTSYTPISLLSVITISIHHKQYPTYLHTTLLQKQPLYKHSTTQHEQHHRNRLQPKQTPERTITVALDMNKAFNTVNIHSRINYTKQTFHTPFSNSSHITLHYRKQSIHHIQK